MLTSILKAIFGSKSARDAKRMAPLVKRINELELSYQKLSEEQLKAKTQEFKERLQKGETLDDILCEAFATVKNACRRLCGTTTVVCDHELTWDMIPFDVQLLGGIALHQRKIAEMATGEGKTLVATMPLYPNALTGKNCQLVTVNDYLARRDSEWMGTIYKYLGLTVGCLQNEMNPDERRAQYACDITYGTNSEFGFDYLRDMGMASSKEQLVQRDHYYAIIDEVDSILIDEARTPLIISGPVASSTHQFDKLKPGIADLYNRQNLLCARLVQEARDILEKEDASDEEIETAVTKLLQVKMGMPQHKKLLHVLEDPEIVVSGVEDEGERNAWEYYVNLVHEMDKFVGELIEAVESRNEPTVLVFYGDHLPTMNLEAKDLKSRYLYNTNYVIWDNIGLEKKDENIAAYQIVAEVFERLDIHTGTVFNYHQQRRETKNYLADLELLQYDMMYGDQYVYGDSGMPVPEEHMVMGVKDAEISQMVVQADGTTYSIYGDNFTKQSKVYINGEKQTTTFLNNTRLDLKESEINDGDTVMVAQVGSSNTIFRESKTYEYNNGTLTELPADPEAPQNGRQAFVEQEEEQEE